MLLYKHSCGAAVCLVLSANLKWSRLHQLSFIIFVFVHHELTIASSNASNYNKLRQNSYQNLPVLLQIINQKSFIIWMVTVSTGT